MNPVIYILSLVCAIWVIYDVWSNKKEEKESKILWTILAILFSIITAIVYFFMKKR